MQNTSHEAYICIYFKLNKPLFPVGPSVSSARVQRNVLTWEEGGGGEEEVEEAPPPTDANWEKW